ncbi:glycosyltransferase family 39 protein [Nostoc sp. ChiQUE01b]|uniref:glycosyltransferase family 39 protein n=1 Tax=Nostoc sp. ChiQUE01b TaxID=3075376 RepID=UPI002AD4FB6E|nr:glycosyltransferase family 39 protein [Nostoc sp. ChiQUE01b]MDZ8257298.1 glycosyltransferase family 39 protein [Nostoc sp. ChiQUE01b]
MTHAEITSNKYRQKFEFIDFRNGKIFDFAVLLICCLSFGFSCIESSVNIDSFHWGFMYVQALDIKRGLIPYKETFNGYGIITSLIQNLSLTFFGERMISIGIMTGVFYATSIFFSYKLFLKILPKYLAYLSILLIFLLHAYIIYPWPNYYSYTFLLLSLLIIFSTNQKKYFFLAGLFLGLSLLSRNSSIIAIIPPFLLFFVYNIVFKKTERDTFSKIVFFSLGFLVPLLLFLFFLINHNTLNDFLIQNKIMLLDSARNITILNFLPRLLKNIFTLQGETFNPDSRLFFFTIIFVWNLVTLFYILYQLLLNKILTKDESILIVFCLVTIFGYLNAIHYYEVFRLVNSSSLGIGVIIHTVFRMSQRLKREIKIIIILPLISICFIWGNSIIFSETSSVYFPWKLDVLTGKGVMTTEIGILKGKILSKKYYDFYQEVYQKISENNHVPYIVNYTDDSVAMVINNLQRVQISSLSSLYFAGVEQAYLNEANKIQKIINAKKAVILSIKDLHIPGYKVVFIKPWVYGEVPWLNDDKWDESLYISVPENVVLK